MSAFTSPARSPAARPLSVAVVTETYPPEGNGVAMTLGRLVAGLRQRGHAVQLVRPRQAGEDATDDVLVRGVPIPRYPQLRAGLVAPVRLVRLWRARPPDVVHVATEGPLGWAAVQAARRLSLPVSSGFHTNFHAYSRHYGLGWLQRPIGCYLRLLHNRSRATLVPTQRLADELACQGYHNLRVVGRGVDRELFHPGRRRPDLRAAWGVGEDGLAVLHVGRLAPEKNLRVVEAAFDALRRLRPDARMIWVGDGPLAAALRRAHPDHVFAGWRRGADLAAHYASGDLFLFPSLTETYGNVTPEALASGVPVIAFDRAAAAERVRHHVTGLVLPPGDDAAFVAAAAALAADVQRLQRMRGAAAEDAAGQDWRPVLDAFEAVLQDLAETPRRTAALLFAP